MSEKNSSDDCGCCEGLTAETPVEVVNRPGLPAVAYRVGIHSRFKDSMLARLSSSELPQLAGLRTDDDDDFSIALLDAWAMVADVLTFYQERIANESYLRTATERRSLLELARLIGYELRPGVAASAHLAFTLETGPGAPAKSTIPAGAKVQSIPGPGEKPQTFETSEALEARGEWNEIKPRLTQTQTLSTTMNTILLKGAGNNLRPGDSLLIVASDADPKFRRIKTVSVDNAADQTQVELESTTAPASTTGSTPAAQPFQSLATSSARQSFTKANIQSLVIGKSWRQSDLASFAFVQGWSLAKLSASIKSFLSESGVPQVTDTGVFAFRVRASLFGYNAPDFNTIPKEVNATSTDWASPLPQPTTLIDLDRVYSEILPDSWVVVTRPALESDPANHPALEPPVIALVKGSKETAAARNALTGKITELTLPLDKPVTLGDFSDLRRTTVYAQSEKLTLADKPKLGFVVKNSIELDAQYSGFKVGQPIAVTGETSLGIVESEIATLADFDDNAGRTTIKLAAYLKNDYKWATFSINANVAAATHGETVTEVLGSGDATRTYPQFTLRESPLTYVGASNASGAATTLEVRVNDLLWAEVPTLFGRTPKERVYVTRTDDDAKTAVQFGDGRTGARLPTGTENVTAKYRKGIGIGGLVDAGQLSLLMTRPLGVKGVTNPLLAAGAADPETRDDARSNTPITVLTLDRIVSLQDYEDFARAFQGVAKALATWTWFGQVRGVFVTVAGTDGAPVESDGALSNRLFLAMRELGDPQVPLLIKSYLPMLFRISAGLRIDSAYRPEAVTVAVEQRLKSAFSFQARSFGQDVTLSEVIAVMQGTPGVIAVDVDKLYRVDLATDLNDRLIASAPRPGADATVSAAELLMIDPNQKVELGVMQ